MTLISIQGRAPSVLTAPSRLTKRWLRILSCRLGLEWDESCETHRFSRQRILGLRQYAKFRRNFGTIVRLVEKRASKTNSWGLATLEEGMDHLRRCHWPTICAKYDFPPEFVQSECYFKSIFYIWLRIEPTEEENQAFRTTAREVYLSLQ
jgi:hypothetical protein